MWALCQENTQIECVLCEGVKGMLRWLNPDSKVHGANMGPIWGRQNPGGPYVGPMNFAIWEADVKF